jgi:hypothetical protein
MVPNENHAPYLHQRLQVECRVVTRNKHHISVDIIHDIFEKCTAHADQLVKIV